MSNPKRAKCPTCGKFLNNDVAALRGHIEVLTTEKESLGEQVGKMKEEIASLRKELDDAQRENRRMVDKLCQKEATIEELQRYEQWLATGRNLWQRIVNRLTPSET